MHQNKQILIVHGRLSSGEVNYGGWRKQLLWLGNNLSIKGHDVTFCTVYDTIRSEHINDLADSIELGLKYYNSFLLRNLFLFLRFPVKIWKVLRSKDYDYVISFGDTTFFILLFLRRFYKFKFIVSERADPNYNVSVWDRLKRRLYAKVDCMVFQTRGAQACFDETIINKSVIIPNPINIPIDMWSISNVSQRIATVGRIDFWQKRQDILIKAFAIVNQRFPDFYLDVYGSGNDMEKLSRLVNELGLASRVVLHGKVTNVQQRLLNNRIFVLSSDFEGIPNALLEAMALGMPVISTKCSPGGAEFVINHNENGLLVDCGDIKNLAESICILINDNMLSTQLGRNARESMRSFSEDSIINLWMNIFS